jgi:hypothetical protein
MPEPLDHFDFRRGHERFVFLAGLSSAVTVSLLLRRDYGQAILFALLGLSCITPILERPRTAGPALTLLIGLAGIALFLGIRLVMPAVYGLTWVPLIG